MDFLGDVMEGCRSRVSMDGRGCLPNDLLRPGRGGMSSASASGSRREDDGDGNETWRIGEGGGLRRARRRGALLPVVGKPLARVGLEELAPGVENKGAVSSREGPIVLEEDESRPRSSPPFVDKLSIEETEGVGRGLTWGAQGVAFSTQGGTSSDVGEGRDEVVDDSKGATAWTAFPRKRLTPFIESRQTAG